MRRTMVYAVSLLMATGGSTAAVASEMHVSCASLPPAVLAQAQAQANGATIRNCVKDVEHGRTTYEVETVKDGKGRDMTLNATGSLVEVEQEVSAESLPAAVAGAIKNAAHGGTVGKIESVTRAGVLQGYETTISRNGKRREVAFTPDGSPQPAD